MSDLSANLPATAAALSPEARAGLVNALKNKLQHLAGEHLDIIESLTPNVRKRVEILQQLQILIMKEKWIENPEIGRYEVWMLGHKDKDGKMKTPYDQCVHDRCLAEVFAKDGMSFLATCQNLVLRPWVIDDFDTFKLKWTKKSWRKTSLYVASSYFMTAVIFVDNSGADIILGILPFARTLLWLMQKLGMVNVELFKGLCQLFEMYYYFVFETFGRQDSNVNGKGVADALNYRLKSAMNRANQDCEQWLRPQLFTSSSSLPASFNSSFVLGHKL